jgi:hypothetical protein
VCIATGLQIISVRTRLGPARTRMDTRVRVLLALFIYLFSPEIKFRKKFKWPSKRICAPPERHSHIYKYY